MDINRGHNHAIYAAVELELNSIIRCRRYDENQNECLKHGEPTSEADGNELVRTDVLTTVLNIFQIGTSVLWGWGLEDSGYPISFLQCSIFRCCHLVLTCIFVSKGIINCQISFFSAHSFSRKSNIFQITF